MKTSFRSTWILTGVSLLLMFCHENLFSQEEFVKKVDKTYGVNKNTRFSIENKYGSIDIRDWNEDQLKIEVEIVVRNVSKKDADKMFNEVRIEFSENENAISAETNYSDEFFDLAGKNFQNNKKFEVRYTIMLPSYLQVNAKNKYGDVFISKLYSASTIRVEYGTLKINELIAENRENMAEIDLAYSKGNIEECQWLRLILKYSKLAIENSKALVAVTKYSKLSIDQGSSLVCDSEYDSYELGILANFVTESQYTNIKISELSNKLILDTKYTDTKVEHISSGFELIQIDNSYGSIKLGIDPKASYMLDGTAKYAQISFSSQGNVNRHQDNNEMRVSGLIGHDERTKSQVRIDTHYGGVNIIP
jgi:hypothetical protein